LKRTPLHSSLILLSPESEWTEVIAISVTDAQPSVRAKAFVENDLNEPPRREYAVDSGVIGVRILPFVKRRERTARKKTPPEST
jgi:hypothetical protein